MKKTELYPLFCSLTPKELDKARVYLEAFTNLGKKGLLLWDAIVAAYQKAKGDWTKTVLDKELLNQKVLGNTKDNSTARNIRSDLFKCLKSYCRFLQFEQDKQDIYALQYYEERDLHRFVKDEYASIQNTLQKKEGIGVIKRRWESYEIYRTLMVKQQITNKVADFQENLKLFEDFQLLKKIQLYAYMCNQRLIFDIDVSLLKKMNDVINEAMQRERIQFIAGIYKVAINILELLKEQMQKSTNLATDENETLHYLNEQYLYLKNILAVNESKILKDDRKLLHQFIYTYQVKRNLRKELTESYFLRYKQGLLHNGRFIPPMVAKNLCSLLPTMSPYDKDEEKAISKIKEIAQQVHVNYYEDIYVYGVGVLYYFQKKYVETILHLEYDIKKRKKRLNKFFQFDERTILLRAYYLVNESDMQAVINHKKKQKEFDKIDALSNGIRNFSVLLKDRSLGPKHIMEYKNFTEGMKQLSHLDNIRHTASKKEKSEQISLLQEFLDNHRLKVKYWFKQQILLF